MNTNKIIIGGIAGGIAFFLLGWLIYGMLLMDYFMANQNQCVMRPMEDMVWWAMIASNLVSGLLVATIFSWANIKGMMAGAKTGAILGLLLGASLDLGFYGMSSMFSSVSAMFVDIIAYTVMAAIAGAVVGWTMGMGK